MRRIEKLEKIKLPKNEQGQVELEFHLNRLNHAGKRDNQVELIRQIRKYILITPLFGGGAEPGVTDPVSAISGKAVRGHLRFWWRATRGGRFGDDLVKLREAEDELWGAPSTKDHDKPSQVQIAIEVTNAGKDDQPFDAVPKPRGRGLKAEPRRGSQVPPYVAFPLQPDNDALQREGKVELKSVRAGVEFTLEISFPKPKDGDAKAAEIKAGVEAALWAWETFGGIGARTRRGFGALSLISINDDAQLSALPPSNNVEQWIQQGLNRHVSTGQWPPNVPHLSRQTQMKVTGSQASPVVAWQRLINKLEAFRQFRKGNRFGKSLWPEADAIRRLVNDSSATGKFPRAVFGLPIVFHFQKQNDPEDAMLVGWEHDRLASPLILRPLICAGNQAVGLAVILVAPLTPPGGLILENEVGDDPVTSTLTPAEAAAILPLKGQTDVLGAFLKTL